MKTIINDDITEDELNELNRVLTDKNIDFDDGDDKRIDNKFNRSVDYFFKNRKMFSKMSIVDIFKWFYYLGVNTESDYKDISIEEVMKIIDDKNFIETVSDCIKNPKDNKRYSIDIDDKDNLVCLTQNCVGSECPCSPQREDCCIDDCNKCSIIIPMSKFNKMINFKDIK